MEFKFILMGIVFLVTVRFIAKSFRGDYTVVKTEIIRSGSRLISDGKVVGAYYDVKTTYKSGRIKIKTYNV